MCAERIAHIAAGFFVLLSLLLGAEASPLLVSKYFLIRGGTIVMPVQSSFTNFCPLSNILAKFGIKGACC